MRHSFEFEEYATILKEHLDSSGYEPISSAGANTIAPNYGNYSVTYYIPIGAETLTNKSVWAVVVEDELDRETQMQTVMPW